LKKSNLVWTNKVVEKIIGKHNIDPEEVEEVFDQDYLVYRARNNSYLALGQSFAGRYIAIFFKNLGEGNAKLITARDMVSKEKKLFRKKRRGKKWKKVKEKQ